MPNDGGGAGRAGTGGGHGRRPASGFGGAGGSENGGPGPVVSETCKRLAGGRAAVSRGGPRPHLVLGGLRGLLAVPGPAPLGEVVDGGELDEGGEHEGVADGDEPVHGRGVGHFGQRVAGADAQRGHGQHRGHAWGTAEAGRRRAPPPTCPPAPPGCDGRSSAARAPPGRLSAGRLPPPARVFGRRAPGPTGLHPGAVHAPPSRGVAPLRARGGLRRGRLCTSWAWARGSAAPRACSQSELRALPQGDRAGARPSALASGTPAVTVR